MEMKEHIKRHKKLHKMLDELVADWISCTECMPSKNTVMDLMDWSYEQTIEPSSSRFK